LIPLVDGVLVRKFEPYERCLIQTEREVEALCVIVATSILNS
jgi:hypothetical protein